jgi:predicted O-methyltransferase YrrM
MQTPKRAYAECTGLASEPWIAVEAIKFLNTVVLMPHMIGLEWGAGASTAWYAKRLKRLYTIEHDPMWAADVQSYLASENIGNNATVYHIPPDDDNDPAYQGDDKITRRTYVRCACAPQVVDFIAIDGRARTACLREAILRLAPGGILLLDDAGRPYGHDRIVSATWEKHDFVCQAYNTAIWLAR